MIENISKSIQDLRALSELYINNALSLAEIDKCKTYVIESLETSRQRLTIAEVLEPLRSVREIYLEDILDLNEYKMIRESLLRHLILSSDNGLDFYGEIFALYKQGLISIKDLHESKKKLIGDSSDDLRMGNTGSINRLRSTYRPFVGGRFEGHGSQIWIETEEGVWRWHLGGPEVRTDANISAYLRVFAGSTVDWGTTAIPLTTAVKLRELVKKGEYIEEEALVLLQGLTETELGAFLSDMNAPQADEKSVILDIFKRLIPIVTA